MRRFSHIPSFLAVALLLLCCGSATRAGSIPIDPDMGLEGTGSNPCSGSEGGACTQNTCMIGCTVQLTNGSGTADIFNDSGFNVVFNMVTVFFSFAPPLNCFDSETFGMAASGGGQTNSFCTWSVDSSTGGIPGGVSYGIIFTNFFALDTALSSGATTPLSFKLTSHPGTVATPEPPSFVLLGTGLAALAAGRKVLKGRRVLGLL